MVIGIEKQSLSYKKRFGRIPGHREKSYILPQESDKMSKQILENSGLIH